MWRCVLSKATLRGLTRPSPEDAPTVIQFRSRVSLPLSRIPVMSRIGKNISRLPHRATTPRWHSPGRQPHIFFLWCQPSEAKVAFILSIQRSHVYLSILRTKIRLFYLFPPSRAPDTV